MKSAKLLLTIALSTIASAAFAQATLIHTFTGALGATPRGALIVGTDGLLYGTTEYGLYKPANATDPGGEGCVFRINKDSNGGFSTTSTVTKIYSFTYVDTTGHNADGAHPAARLLQIGVGTSGAPILAGTTSKGGPKGDGTVFELTPSTTGTYTESTLHAFAGTDGSGPTDGLILGSDGNLYGTTAGGGGTGKTGTIFQLTTAGVLTTLHSFGAGDGSHPETGVVEASDGNLYGVTPEGATPNFGTLYRCSLSGTFAVVHVFQASPNEPCRPDGDLIQATDGNLYGTSLNGGADGNGTLFQCTLAGAITVIHSFVGADGARPYAGVIQGVDGNLYGTTTEGGAAPTGSNPVGAVYQVKGTGGSFSAGSAETVLATFSVTSGSSPKGKFPFGGLVQTADAKLYGVGEYGGAGKDVFGNPADFGTVFTTAP